MLAYVIVFTLALILPGSMSSEAEERLLDTLFKNYNTLVRPVKNHSDVLNVHLSIHISQIIDVDQKHERFVLSVLLKLMWHDYRLSWNVSEYDGVTSIRLPRSKIWTPDIVLYNRVQQESNEGEEKWLIWVTSNGLCTNNPLTIVTARCSIDIRWFPFDEQLCALVYESWTHDSSLLNLTIYSNGTELALLEPNSEWHIKELRSTRGSKYYTSNYPYISVGFQIQLCRKVLYYVVNLILPCALISFLTPLSFLIPIEAGDRIGMGITIMLAMSVYQIIVLDRIPTSSEGVPLIGMYFIILISVNAVAIVMMIAIVNLRQPKTTPMPRRVRSFIFNYLSRLLMMSPPPASSIPEETQMDDITSSPDTMLYADCDVKGRRRDNNTSDDPESNDRQSDTSVDYYDAMKQKQMSGNHCVANQLATVQQTSTVKPSPEMDDWMFTARVVERACVLFFGAFQAVCSLALSVFIVKSLDVTAAEIQRPAD